MVGFIITLVVIGAIIGFAIWYVNKILKDLP